MTENTKKIDILSLSLGELKARLLELGEKPFRANQIFAWIHQRSVRTFDEMNNISKALREKLGEHFFITDIKLITRQIDENDATEKYLFDLGGEYIETVVMTYSDHISICLSSQAGCRMGCTFCASGKNGLSRNLTASEILSQFYYAESLIGKRISHIVYMGTGEPLDNFDNVIRSIELFSDENGRNISKRNITLSTCGIVPKIYELAEYKYPITLALSLHSTSDENRKKTMPISNKYSIDDMLKAMEYYFAKTKRRVSFEYALIQGVNDSIDDSVRLASLIRSRDFKAHINLILVNNVVENYYQKPDKKAVKAFMDNLIKSGIDCTMRRSVGASIDGACGQLRLKTNQSN